MVRTFSGRGMTLAQLNAATQAEALKKQQAQQAALQKLAQEAVLQKPVVKSAPTSSTPITASTLKQVAQILKKSSISSSSKSSTGSSSSSKSTTGSSSSSKSSTSTQGRFERSTSAAPSVGSTVIRNGKTYIWGGNASQRAVIKAEAAANINATRYNYDLYGGMADRFTTTTLTDGSYYDVDIQLQEIYKAAMANSTYKSLGYSIPKPVTTYGKTITSQSEAQKIIDSYASKASPAYYDISEQISSIDAQLRELGTSVVSYSPTPVMKKVFLSEKEAQAAIDAYAVRADTALTTASVNSVLKDIYNQAKSYGVTVPVPVLRGGISSVNAQSIIDSYLEKVNAALESAPAPVYSSIDPQKKAGYAFTVTMSHSQQNQFLRENQTKKAKGQAELTEYEFRQKHNISTETTDGKYIKTKITNNSYSSKNASSGNGTIKAVKDGGSYSINKASIGSGDLKIAAIKTSSNSISSNNKAISVISAADTAKQKQAAVTAKNVEAAKATAEAAKAAQAKKDAAAVLAAKQKALAQTQAAAKKTASITTKAELQTQAKTLQKEVATAKSQVKAATEAATATAKYANAMGANAHYADIAVSTGSSSAAKKASTALKEVKATKAKAEKAVEKADAAGVTVHTGQVLLKDGTWKNVIEASSSRGKGSRGVTSYFDTLSDAEKAGRQKEYENRQKTGKTGASQSSHSTKSYVEKLKVDKENAKKAAEVSAKAEANYRQLRDDLGRVVDAITVNHGFSTGERNVTYISKNAETGTTFSKSAQTYKNEREQAEKLAEKAITTNSSEAEKKAIQDARTKLESYLGRLDQVKYKNELKRTDEFAQKIQDTVSSATQKYLIAHPNATQKEINEALHAFEKDTKRILKDTKGMTEAEKQKYLLAESSKSLSATGKASDFWTTLNTDIFENAGVSGSLLGTVKYKLGDKSATPLTFGNKSTHVASGRLDKFATNQVNKNSSVDVMDNIAKKQLNNQPLSAAEVALLTSVNDGYKPSSTVNTFVAGLGRMSEFTENKIQSNWKVKKATDYGSLNKSNAETVADFVNSMRNAVLTVPEMTLGFMAGGLKAIEYTGHEASKGIKSGSVTGVKHSLANIGLSGTLVTSNMARGSVQQYQKDPVAFVSSLALTQIAMGGIGKAITKPVKYTASKVALKTGITRTKAVGAAEIPYKEVGTILDDMRAGKTITGLHAAVHKTKKGETVYVNEPGLSAAYKEPGTFGHKGMFTTVSDAFVDPYGKFFLSKSRPLSSTASEAVSKVKRATVGKVISTVKSTDKEMGIPKTEGTRVTNPVTGRSFVIKKGLIGKKLAENKTVQKISAVDKKLDTLPSDITKWTARQLKGNFVKNYNKFAYRRAFTGEKEVTKFSGDPVKLSETQWNRVFQKFKIEGNFWSEYETIQKIAQKQADATGRPVATPSPKSAKGWMQAESEVWWVFPKKGVKVTSKQRIGKTENGVNITEVSFDKNMPVKKKSISQRMKENREYNKQTFKALDGKTYNINHLKSAAIDANRRLGEIYGNKTTRPGAYEGGLHGKSHTEKVGKTVGEQLKKADAFEYWLGVMHDVTKIGEKETAGIPHAVAAGEVIKRGMITDARFNAFWDSLSKGQKSTFVKAISEHTTIKPINRHLLTEWSLTRKVNKKNWRGRDKTVTRLSSDITHPLERVKILKEGIKTAVKDRPSIASKALATADRLDFVRFNIKPQKRQMWNLKTGKKGVSVTESLKAKAGKLKAKSIKASSKTRSATAFEKIKVVEKKTRGTKIKGNSKVREMSAAEKNRRMQIKMLRDINKHRAPDFAGGVAKSTQRHLRTLDSLEPNKTLNVIKLPSGEIIKTGLVDVAARNLLKKGAKWKDFEYPDKRISVLEKGIEDIQENLRAKSKTMPPEEFKKLRLRSERDVKQIKHEIAVNKWVKKTKERIRNAEMREAALQKKTNKIGVRKSPREEYYKVSEAGKMPKYPYMSTNYGNFMKGLEYAYREVNAEKYSYPSGYKSNYGTGSYKKPGYNKPEYRKPDYNKPEYRKPDYKRPDYKKPDYKRPDYKKPDYKRPDYKKPDYNKPDYKRPDYKKPKYTLDYTVNGGYNTKYGADYNGGYTPQPYDYPPPTGTAHYSGGSYSKRVVPPLPIEVRKKKKPSEGLKVRKSHAKANIGRKIQNRLGSLESLFGGARTRKPAAKAVTKKAPAKKTLAKKVVNRARRA